MSEDIAWAAGLFEGEGYFSLKQRSPRYQAHLEMGLSMTDKDVVERFAAVTGMGVRPKRVRKDKPHWKDSWTCTIGGARALALAQLFEPYLGTRRLARLYELRAAIYDSRPQPRRCVCCGETFTPPRFRNMQKACSEKCRDRSKYLRRRYGIESDAEAYEIGLSRIPGSNPLAALLRAER